MKILADKALVVRFGFEEVIGKIYIDFCLRSETFKSQWVYDITSGCKDKKINKRSLVQGIDV